MRQPGLSLFPAAAWPVPGSVPVRTLPPAVLGSLERIFLAPPKPVVTREVMNQAQFSMIAPDLPWRAQV